MALLLTLVLSACVMTTSPPPAPAPRPAPNPAPPPQPVTGFVINSRLGVPGYPGTVGLKRERADGSSEVEFETRADIDEVYAFFHNQLVSRGWVRTSLEMGGKGNATKVEATYQRGGSRFKFQLNQKGKSGKYTLEINF